MDKGLVFVGKFWEKTERRFAIDVNRLENGRIFRPSLKIFQGKKI